MVTQGLQWSQSPFGFWGDWNLVMCQLVIKDCIVTIAFRLLGWLEHIWDDQVKGPPALCHNRLSAFGVIGTKVRLTSREKRDTVTIAFRLLGWLELIENWNLESDLRLSQSPFGFWGDWNYNYNSQHCKGVVVTIAFRLLGWLEQVAWYRVFEMTRKVTIAFRLLGWLEPDGRKANQGLCWICHNRLSAFGVIGTTNKWVKQATIDQVTIAFRLLGWLELSKLVLIENWILSQSPFGFWGDWNKIEMVDDKTRYRGHNRLSAFGVIGTTKIKIFVATED